LAWRFLATATDRDGCTSPAHCAVVEVDEAPATLVLNGVILPNTHCAASRNRTTNRGGWRRVRALPGPAGVDLQWIRLLVQTVFPRGTNLKCLTALVTYTLRRSMRRPAARGRHLPEGPTTGLSGEVFLVAGLFADQHHLCRAGPSRHKVCVAFLQQRASAALRGPVRQFLRYRRRHLRANRRVPAFLCIVAVRLRRRDHGAGGASGAGDQ